MTAAMFLFIYSSGLHQRNCTCWNDSTTVAPVENNADNHENEVVEEYQPKEKLTLVLLLEMATYYHVNMFQLLLNGGKLTKNGTISTKRHHAKVQSLTVTFSERLQEKWHKNTVKVENTFYADENGRIVYNSLVEAVMKAIFVL